MMGVAIADFHWTPDAFWRATPAEFFSAWELVQIRARAAEG